MDFPQYNDAKQHLLNTINILAPTGLDQQRRAVDLLHALEANGESRTEVLRSLVQYLADGVFYGNWPSTINKRP